MTMDRTERIAEVKKLSFKHKMVGVRVVLVNKEHIDIDNEGLQRIGVVPEQVKIQKVVAVNDYDGVLMTDVERMGKVDVKDYSDIIDQLEDLRESVVSYFDYALDAYEQKMRLIMTKMKIVGISDVEFCGEYRNGGVSFIGVLNGQKLDIKAINTEIHAEPLGSDSNYKLLHK